MYTEVFSPESKTSWFNRAFDQIRNDKRVIELLGDSKKMKAFGEVNANSWRKTRPIQSVVKKDQYGTEHLMMHFYVCAFMEQDARTRMGDVLIVTLG